LRGQVCRREQCGVHFVSQKRVSLKLPWPWIRAGYMQTRIYAGLVRRYSDVSILRTDLSLPYPSVLGEESR
jgi:hypothetical protein